MASMLPPVISYKFAVAIMASGGLFRTSCDIGILDALLQTSYGRSELYPRLAICRGLRCISGVRHLMITSIGRFILGKIPSIAVDVMIMRLIES